MTKVKAALALGVTFTALAFSACGSKKKSKSEASTSSSKKSSSAAITASSGEVLIRKISLKAGKALSMKTAFKGLSLAATSTSQTSPFEVSLQNADGTELSYTRDSATSVATAYTATSDESLTVTVKNNTSTKVTLDTDQISGTSTDSGFSNASARDTSTSNILIKAVIAFANNCQAYDPNGGSNLNFPAPTGEYHVDPFVFVGKVGADKKVTPISTATVTISFGGKTISLKKLSDIDSKVYGTLSTSSATDQLNYAKVFYQGFFGAAGELYTTDYFYYGGDCTKSTTLALGTDVGTADVELSVTDSSQTPALNVKQAIHPTISIAVGTYTGDAQKLSDYTQCTYDRLTGEPTTYNGSASTCKTFSSSDLPYVMLEDTMPGDRSGGQLTHASDPTRIMYYGNSNPKAWYKALVQNADALIAGTQTSVDLQTCFTNGGLLSVPIATSKTYLPLSELNAATNDVINIGQRTGTYTALTDYYQGDIDVSGSFTMPTCIPKDGVTCGYFKNLTVKVQNCTAKADSGIYTMSTGDRFLYPGDFSISGILGN